MNTAAKATLATIVVVALMLSSVGMTYSWFSASQEYRVDIVTSSFDVDYSLYSEGSSITDNAISLEDGTSNNFVLKVTNNNDVPVAFEASFTVPRYAAYTASDHSGTSYAGELRPNGTDSYSLDDDLTSQHRNGFRENSIYAITVDFADSGQSALVGTNSTFTTTIGGVTYYVVETEYSATYYDVILPGSSMNIPISITVGSGYTNGSILDPVIRAESTQINSTGSVAEAALTEDESTLSGTFDVSGLNGSTTLVFSDDDRSHSISFDWQSLGSEYLNAISVEITENTESIAIKVSATDDSGNPVQLDGRVSYSIAVGDKGVASVMSGDHCISCTVTEDGGITTVTFSDTGSSTSHTIGLAGGA